MRKCLGNWNKFLPILRKCLSKELLILGKENIYCPNGVNDWANNYYYWAMKYYKYLNIYRFWVFIYSQRVFGNTAEATNKIENTNFYNKCKGILKTFAKNIILRANDISFNINGKLFLINKPKHIGFVTYYKYLNFSINF